MALQTLVYQFEPFFRSGMGWGLGGLHATFRKNFNVCAGLKLLTFYGTKRSKRPQVLRQGRNKRGLGRQTLRAAICPLKFSELSFILCLVYICSPKLTFAPSKNIFAHLGMFSSCGPVFNCETVVKFKTKVVIGKQGFMQLVIA